MYIKLILALCLILGFTSFSCTAPHRSASKQINNIKKITLNQHIDSKARSLLKKYDLNPISNDPTYEIVSLRNINSHFDVVKRESIKIGLHFKYKEGEKATALKYLLKEKSKSPDLKRNQVYAHIIYKGQEITGAYLDCGGYFPSTVGMSDHTLLENK